MKALILATAAAGMLAATVPMSTPAEAQSLRVGPGGVTVETESPREYRRVRERRWVDRDECRTITIRERDDFGRMRVKRIERCG